MACTCTEDKEVIGNVTIGRNKVTCQECIDAQVLQEKNMKRQTLLGQLAELEKKIYYSQLDGDEVWVAKKMGDRAILKTELASLKN
jgi:hypothetical protein